MASGGGEYRRKRIDDSRKRDGNRRPWPMAMTLRRVFGRKTAEGGERERKKKTAQKKRMGVT